ncbi:MAG TPA: hypothetical protein VEX38_03670 [Fimbriimonadaceae bacterium]|nr:hypothetical protein [Fimbriimonadaceae bacterium]
MPRTLLIGTRDRSWREWLHQNASGRDLVLLDPLDTSHGPPGRVALIQDGKVRGWRFFGSLDAQRAPHVIVAALCDFLSRAHRDPVVQLFSYRASAVLRHLAIVVAQTMRAEEIFVAEGVELELEGWPVGPERVQLPSSFPDLVQNAQRKARWMELIADCTEQRFLLKGVTIEGARLGSGTPVDQHVLQKAGIESVLHAEVCGSTLFLVCDGELDEGRIARALDVTHCARATVASPCDYANLLCSVCHQDGEDFGMGTVRSIDFKAGAITLLTNAIPPVPARIVRLGSLRVDESGKELGETRPWQI